MFGFEYGFRCEHVAKLGYPPTNISAVTPGRRSRLVIAGTPLTLAGPVFWGPTR